MINCSFCGKSQEECKKLIGGVNVYICEECILLCVKIIFSEGFDQIKHLKSLLGESQDRAVIFKEFWGTDV